MPCFICIAFCWIYVSTNCSAHHKTKRKYQHVDHWVKFDHWVCGSLSQVYFIHSLLPYTPSFFPCFSLLCTFSSFSSFSSINSPGSMHHLPVFWQGPREERLWRRADENEFGQEGVNWLSCSHLKPSHLEFFLRQSSLTKTAFTFSLISPQWYEFVYVSEYAFPFPVQFYMRIDSGG